MKSFFLFLFLLVLLVVTLTAQDLFSSVIFCAQVRLVLFPIIFCFAALALPFPAALLFAIITGLIEGLLTMQIQHAHVEIRLGWFIFFFMFWATALQFLSDLTEGVRWELHALGSGLCTATFLFGEFLILSFSRGHFSITGDVLTQSFFPAGAAFLLAPFFYMPLQLLWSPAKETHLNHYPLPL